MNLGNRPIPEHKRAEWLNQIRQAQDCLNELESALLDVLDHPPQGCECPACEMGESGHDAYVAAYEAKSRGRENG